MNHDPIHHEPSNTVVVPAPTVAPLVLAVGVALISFGIATHVAFLLVGWLVLIFGLTLWIGQLLPGNGHEQVPFDRSHDRALVTASTHVAVEKLRAGMPGYRLRLPVKVHPVSAGILGGIAGGLVMPIPALAYGIFSGHGFFWPVNLLAGIVLPGIGSMSTEELERFHPALLAWGIAIHIVVSLIMGLMYGVLMPTLPEIAKPVAWGALLMPLLWTAVSYLALGQMNPLVRDAIEWPWFIVSQLVFGIVAAIVFILLEHRGALAAGIVGGIAGGALMPVPAILWSIAAGHSIWYPANLLSALVFRHSESVLSTDLEQYQANWLAAAMAVHLVLSLSFGVAFSIVLPRVPTIPAPLAWGGLLLPLLWTGTSYGMMGIVNPVLQQQVAWWWFIASQFVFGVVAAIVVVRSEQVDIPPAGQESNHDVDGPGPGSEERSTSP